MTHETRRPQLCAWVCLLAFRPVISNLSVVQKSNTDVREQFTLNCKWCLFIAYLLAKIPPAIAITLMRTCNSEVHRIEQEGSALFDINFLLKWERRLPWTSQVLDARNMQIVRYFSVLQINLAITKIDVSQLVTDRTYRFGLLCMQRSV
jgi:hypothetical protein